MSKKRIFAKLNIIIILTLVILVAVVELVNRNKFSQLIGEEKQVKSTIEAWDTSKVTPVTSLDGITVPVPKGYTVSSVESERYVNSGLVIYEGENEVNESNIEEAKKTRNQWVWVPVPDVSRIYSETNGVKKGKSYDYTETGRTIKSGYSEPKILSTILTDYDNEYYFSGYGLQGMTREKFYQEMKIEFENTIESIKTYGGFYIGRYETGDLSKKIPVIRRMNEDIGSQTWYELYGKAKYLGTNSNVKANMIWGCFWDETLEWLIESGSKAYADIVDSTSWGNYSDSEFIYETIDGGMEQKEKGTRSIKIPAGSSEYTKANNIYDMAGNVEDWTLEVDNYDGRCNRGGFFSFPGNLAPISFRNYGFPHESYNLVGFRAYLYIT